MEKKRQTGQKHTMTTKLPNRRGKKKHNERIINSNRKERKKETQREEWIDRENISIELIDT